MRRLPASGTKGFTLIEVLVISPIIILFIGAFISLAVGLTGESLQLREKNSAIYDVQAALNTMEASIVQTTGFMSSTSGVLSPQGQGNSATQFTNATSPNNTLILKSAATTMRPTDPARSLIYMGTGACNNRNPLYTYTTVFFVDPNTNSLYKRTILPQQPACAQPWQRGSCNSADIAANGTICKAQDEKLLDNVSAVNITYYDNATSTTALTAAQASSASSVSISITLTKQAGGATITYTNPVPMRATSLNASTSSVATPPPATPAIAWSRNPATPYTTTFTWDQVGSATGYNIRYRLGSGTWVNGPQNQAPANTTYSIVGTARKQNEDIEVTVLSTAGNYLYGTMNTTLASWEECTPLNGWQNYDTQYNTQGFTKTTSGAVGLKGLIRSGPIGYNGAYTTCVLPVGFRPANHLIFNGVAADSGGLGGNGSARIDIFPDGSIIVTGGSAGVNNGFVSLDGIIFLTTDSGVSWQAGTWLSPWYFNSYSDTYPNLGYWRDSLGRTWVQGLGTGGAGQSVPMANIPAGMGPANGGMHINVNTANVGGVINAFGSTTNTLNSRASTGNYVSTQLLFYSTGGLIPMNFYNGWHNYGSGWSSALCYQGTDDIVIVQGLIAGGTNQAAATHVGVCGASPYMSTGRRALFGAIVNSDVQGRFDMPTDNYLYAWASNSGWSSMDAIHYIAN